MIQRPVPELAIACAEQRRRYVLGEESDASACFALFERAIVLGDEQAWGAVMAAFGPQVVGWVRRHPCTAQLPDSPEDYASMVWTRFLRSISPDRFEGFPRLASLLSYLQRCVASTLLDERRRLNGRPPDDVRVDDLPPVRDPSGGPEASVATDLFATSVWDTVSSLLKNDRERIVLHEVFVRGRKPNEIWRRHPEEFDSASDVSRVKENVLARLRRDPAVVNLASVRP